MSLLALVGFLVVVAFPAELRYLSGSQKTPSFCADESKLGPLYPVHAYVYRPLGFVATVPFMGLEQRSRKTLYWRKQAQQSPEGQAALANAQAKANDFQKALSPATLTLGTTEGEDALRLNEIRQAVVQRCAALEAAGITTSSLDEDKAEGDIVASLKEGDVELMARAYLNPAISADALSEVLQSPLYSNFQVRSAARRYADSVFKMEQDSWNLQQHWLGGVEALKTRDAHVTTRPYSFPASARDDAMSHASQEDTEYIANVYLYGALGTKDLLRALEEFKDAVLRRVIRERGH